MFLFNCGFKGANFLQKSFAYKVQYSVHEAFCPFHHFITVHDCYAVEWNLSDVDET